MKRGTLLMLGLLLAAAAAGTWLVAGGGASQAPSGRLARPQQRETGLPTFDATAPASRPAGEVRPVLPGNELDTAVGTERASAAPAEPMRRVSGKVVRASDGTPYEGARLEARGLVEPATTRSQQDGTFDFQAPAAASELRVGKGRSDDEAMQAFRLAAGDVANLLVVLDSGFTLRARVVDQDDLPIADAEVEVDDQAATRTRTDADGRCDIRDITCSDGTNSVTCKAQAPLHTRERIHVLAPPSVTIVVPVQIRLQASGALEGRLTDEKGEPLDREPVVVVCRMTTSHGEMAPSHLRADTRADGTWRIDNVPPGTWVVRAGKGGSLGIIELAMNLSVAGRGEATGDVRPGEVVIHDGMTIAPELRQARVAQRLIKDVVVEAGRTTRLDVVLRPGAVIAGRVTDTSGAPLPGATLALRRVVRWPAPDINGSSSTSDGEGFEIITRGGGGQGESVMSQPEGQAETDEHGDYEFTNLSAGEKTLTASGGAGSLRPQQRVLQVQDGERLTTVDFVLAAGSSLRGRVVDPSGAPVEGASVHVKPLDTHTFYSGDAQLTDAAGRFEATGLPPEKQRLSIWKEGYASVWEEVEPGGAERTFVLTPSPKVRGEVIDAVHDRPIEVLNVSIEKEGSIWSTSGQQYDEGRFALDAEDDTPCTVRVSADGFEEQVREGVVPSSTEAAPLRFLLKPRP